MEKIGLELETAKEQPKTGRRDIVAIGASAGGLEAISGLLKNLPSTISATIFAVLHRPPARLSSLPQILRRETPLPVAMPHDGTKLQHGTCYVGSTNLHLTVGSDQKVQLLHDGFYSGHNIDPLFCSLARHAGSRTIGVVLSGVDKDGSLGLKAIKDAGGIALVQSPEEASFSDMPRNAIKYGRPVDFVGPVHALANEFSGSLAAENPDGG